MDIFDPTISQIRTYIEARQHRSEPAAKKVFWPPGGAGNIVFGKDIGLELGSPGTASLSTLIWTSTPGLVSDDRITLIGNDMGESSLNSLPFAKLLLVEVEGFTGDNAYHRHMEMEAVRYDLDLKGYMIRAVSRARKEWCRISKEALSNGFSFFLLGSVFIEKLKKIPYIQKVEIIYITSSVEDVRKITSITEHSARIITAMNKMVKEMELDCTVCDYSDVCNEVEMLSGMRKKLRESHVH
jgi:CO dehydrogenase/acetyl-CoA synthase beta subunit